MTDKHYPTDENQVDPCETELEQCFAIVDDRHAALRATVVQQIEQLPAEEKVPGGVLRVDPQPAFDAFGEYVRQLAEAAGEALEDYSGPAINLQVQLQPAPMPAGVLVIVMIANRWDFRVWGRMTGGKSRDPRGGQTWCEAVLYEGMQSIQEYGCTDRAKGDAEGCPLLWAVRDGWVLQWLKGAIKRCYKILTSK